MPTKFRKKISEKNFRKKISKKFFEKNFSKKKFEKKFRLKFSRVDSDRDQFSNPRPSGSRSSRMGSPFGFHHPLRKCRQVRVPVRHYFVARGDQSLRGLVITVGAQWAFLQQLGEIPGGIPTSVGFTFLLLTRTYLGGRRIYTPTSVIFYRRRRRKILRFYTPTIVIFYRLHPYKRTRPRLKL